MGKDSVFFYYINYFCYFNTKQQYNILPNNKNKNIAKNTLTPLIGI